MIAASPIEEFLPLLRGVVPDGQNKWKAYCSVHEADGQTHNPSLRVMVGADEKVVVKCMACDASTAQIVQAAGSSMHKLFRKREREAKAKSSGGKKSNGFKYPTARMAIASIKNLGTEAGQWTYRNVAAEAVSVVVRFNAADGSKQFRPVSLIDGGWYVKGPPGLRFLYRLDELVDVTRLCIFEGEKKTDKAREYGLDATTSMNGSKSAGKTDWSIANGKYVVIFPDHDEPGTKYANDVARLCVDAGALSVKIVELPGLTDGEDIVEWIAAFGADADKATIQAEIESLIEAAQIWTTPVNASSGKIVPIDAAELATTVQNFELIEQENEEGEPKLVPSPLPIKTIEDRTKQMTGDWPRSVSGQLFIHREDRKCIQWLPDADALFSHLGKVTGNPPNFKSNGGFHSKREFYSHLQRNTTHYLAVEEAPHEPPIANHFYACPTPKSGDGETLRTRINRFAPETMVDWDLIWAAFVTPFWGGDGGTRPAFCITAPDRGAGKSKLVKFIAQLSGGYLDISSNEDIATLKTRLLSTEATAKRVVLFDNIKTSKLSWAELESLITCPIVSGKRMYVGEFQRPNTFTYFLTMNGASFSRDMAQRCAVIKLKMPEYSGDWEGETQRFIDQNRQALIDDVIGFLKQPSEALLKFSRWADWERAVVSRLADPAEAQSVIVERQIGVDIDNEEAAVIEEFFSKELEKLGYDVAADRVFIPTTVACRWLGWSMNDKFTTTKSSQMLKQRIEAKAFRCIAMCRGRANGRGFEFWGRNSNGGNVLHTDIESKMKMRGYSNV